MSVSSRTFRGTRDHDEIVAPARRYGTTSRAYALDSLIATDGRAAGTVARLALGLVMFPHGAQKMLGWFGGYGFTGTFAFLTAKAGLPDVVAGAVVFTELVTSLLLITGAFTRIAPDGVPRGRGACNARLSRDPAPRLIYFGGKRPWRPWRPGMAWSDLRPACCSCSGVIVP